MNLYKKYRELKNQDQIHKEAVELADWMIDHRCTVRQLSKEFMIPRSTVFRRISLNLKEADYEKYIQCRNILQANKKDRAHRGAIARMQNRLQNASKY